MCRGYSFSIVAMAQVWDSKFPCVVLPYSAFRSWPDSRPVMSDASAVEVKKAVREHVASLMAWSAKVATSGVFPAKGFWNEAFKPKSWRGKMAGQELALGWRRDCLPFETHVPTLSVLCRGVYFSCRYDAKARVECNFFYDRYYLKNKICETCMACKPTGKNADPHMNYQDFRDGPRQQTFLNDATYRRTASIISPWHKVPGWSLHTCCHDLLHVVYLGTAKDMIGSLLADWLEHDLLEGRTVDDKLKRFSIEMHANLRAEGFPDYLSNILVFSFI